MKISSFRVVIFRVELGFTEFNCVEEAIRKRKVLIVTDNVTRPSARADP